MRCVQLTVGRRCEPQSFLLCWSQNPDVLRYNKDGLRTTMTATTGTLLRSVSRRDARAHAVYVLTCTQALLQSHWQLTNRTIFHCRHGRLMLMKSSQVRRFCGDTSLCQEVCWLMRRRVCVCVSRVRKQRVAPCSRPWLARQRQQVSPRPHLVKTCIDVCMGRNGSWTQLFWGVLSFVYESAATTCNICGFKLLVNVRGRGALAFSSNTGAQTSRVPSKDHALTLATYSAKPASLSEACTLGVLATNCAGSRKKWTPGTRVAGTLSTVTSAVVETIHTPHSHHT